MRFFPSSEFESGMEKKKWKKKKILQTGAKKSCHPHIHTAEVCFGKSMTSFRLIKCLKVRIKRITDAKGESIARVNEMWCQSGKSVAHTDSTLRSKCNTDITILDLYIKCVQIDWKLKVESSTLYHYVQFPVLYRVRSKQLYERNVVSLWRDTLKWNSSNDFGCTRIPLFLMKNHFLAISSLSEWLLNWCTIKTIILMGL